MQSSDLAQRRLLIRAFVLLTDRHAWAVNEFLLRLCVQKVLAYSSCLHSGDCSNSSCQTKKSPDKQCLFWKN